MSYQIVTDATADLNEELQKGLSFIEIIPMEVLLGEKKYLYGPEGNISSRQFYELQRSGLFAETSQINPQTYKEVFEWYLENGKDVLYLGFSSGLSGTIGSANLAARELEEKYPERKIFCVDTLCASVGEGFIVREAAKKQAEGMELEELVEWVNEHCLKVSHWFTVDTFQHLLHGGRVSQVVAMAGTVLNIKPLLNVDKEGKLQVKGKPRGSRQALKVKLEQMEKSWMPELGKLVIVGHGDCTEEGTLLYDVIQERFPEAELYLADIGPIIGAHTGPGMTAVIYWGCDREH